VKVKIYVEGSGDTRADQQPLREAFRKLFERAGFAGRMPTFVGCGSRQNAFRDFKIALRNPDTDTTYLLLVDSEDPVENNDPWEHLRTRVGDGWERPANVNDSQVHFMATCMETWLIADRDNLKNFFGHCLNENVLPAIQNPETRNRKDLLRSLEKATETCDKKKYGKGEISFKLLALTNPTKLRELHYFQRLLNTLEEFLS
jgi:hypothetical protein